LAAVPPSGPAALPGPPFVTVRLTDHGCRVPRTVRSAWLRIRVVNRGRYVHTFTIRGRRLSLHPGRKAVLRVSFPRPGRYAYTCSRRGLPRLQRELRVVLVPTAAKPCGVWAVPPRLSPRRLDCDGEQ